jgi:hypothetical protein
MVLILLVVRPRATDGCRGDFRIAGRLRQIPQRIRQNRRRRRRKTKARVVEE